MECRVLSKIFDINEPLISSSSLSRIVETLLEIGETLMVNIEFTDNFCKHSTKPSKIFWRDLPIMKIECLGKEINFFIQNNNENIINFLLKNLFQLPSIHCIKLLVKLRLPQWYKAQEFIVIINKLGGICILPTDFSFSSKELMKLQKQVKMYSERKIINEEHLELIDVLFPDEEIFNEFRIRF